MAVLLAPQGQGQLARVGHLAGQAQRLDERGYANYAKHRGLTLTADGERVAGLLQDDLGAGERPSVGPDDGHRHGRLAVDGHDVRRHDDHNHGHRVRGRGDRAGRRHPRRARRVPVDGAAVHGLRRRDVHRVPGAHGRALRGRWPRDGHERPVRRRRRQRGQCRRDRRAAPAAQVAALAQEARREEVAVGVGEHGQRVLWVSVRSALCIKLALAAIGRRTKSCSGSRPGYTRTGTPSAWCRAG